MPPSTQDLIALDRAHLWHPFTPMKPWVESKDFLVIERGDREFLIDTDGNRYLDGTSSLWCNVHGHRVAELDAAVKDQLDKVAHTTLLGMANVPSVLLAKRLADLTAAAGLPLPRVFYSDNGSTAVEVACKLAFQYHQITTRGGRPAAQDAPRFIAFRNSYHGDTLGAVSLGGIDLFHSVFKPLCFHTDFVDVGPGAPAQVDALLSAHPGQYAAVIIEPLVQGAGGMALHPAGTLAKVREVTARHDTLLIADEVLTAFGRTGTMFACEQEGVTPDLLCLSKGLTAGYMPLGVTMTREKIFEAFYADPRELKTFFHGHTYTGHPLACATALANLDLIENRGLLAHVAALAPVLDSALARARALPYVADARRIGLIGAIDLRDERGEAFPYHYRVGGAVCRHARDAKPVGLILRPLADTVVVMPPLGIARENLVYLCEALLKSVAAVPGIVARVRSSG